MMNLSLQSRFSILLWSFSLGTLLIILTSFALHGVEIFMLVFLLAPIGVSALGQWLVRRWLAPLVQLNAVVADVAQGRFNSRIIGASQTDEIGLLCWNVNDMLDQLGAFFREQETSFRSNLAGTYFRVAMNGGMHGGFTLVKKPTDISLLDIMEAIHGPAGINVCAVDSKKCHMSSSCAVHPVWVDIRKEVERRLKKETIDKLLGK
jgi:HAMP domain-containing protein